MAAVATGAAVRALVYESVFKRAKEIAASDKLRSVVFEGEGLLKGTAECIGSSPSDIYALRVSIDGATVVGDCSCPAGKSAKAGLCKHVVALLLRRIQELKGPETSPSESPPEVASIASQIDDIVTREDAKSTADGGETIQSTVPKRPGPSTSSSKRALPAWMLGVVGSDNGPKPSSSNPKSNKRAAESKPPRPAPPPTRRARRSGQPLKISNESDEGEEVHDPGEVHDAAPMAIEKCSPPLVTEDEEVPETVDIPSEGAAARERRRLRALKKDVVAADDDGNEGVKRAKVRSSRAVSKEVIDQPVRASKRKRLAKKYVEEDDGSENGAAPLDADAGDGFGLTDEDLMFLAQEQLEKEKATLQAEDERRPKAPEAQVEEKPPENCSQGKKSSSIFSMSNWKEMSSEGRGTGGATSSSATDNIDWETLKNYSLGANSYSNSQVDRPSSDATDAAHGLLPSFQTAQPATFSKDVRPSTPTISRSDDIDAVANDMLDIFFGSTQSKESAKNVPAASSGPRSYQEDEPNYCAAEVGLEAPPTSFSAPQSDTVAPTVSAIRNDVDDLGVEFRPKKKSSLKDRVKMLLS